VQRPVIRNITISAPKHINMHSKWDKQQQQYYSLHLSLHRAFCSLFN